MKYDGILVALYVLVLIVIAYEFFSQVALTVVIVLLLVLVAVQKSGLEKLIRSTEGERNKRLDEISAKIDDVSRKADNFKEDLNRQVVFVDNKVSEVRQFVEGEVSNVYSEISNRVTQLEDKLEEIRQGFSAAIGSLDERIRPLEKEEEEPSDAF